MDSTQIMAGCNQCGIEDPHNPLVIIVPTGRDTNVGIVACHTCVDGMPHLLSLANAIKNLVPQGGEPNEESRNENSNTRPEPDNEPEHKSRPGPGPETTTGRKEFGDQSGL